MVGTWIPNTVKPPHQLQADLPWSYVGEKLILVTVILGLG